MEDLEWFKTDAGGPLGLLAYKACSVRSLCVKESSSGNLNPVILELLDAFWRISGL